MSDPLKRAAAEAALEYVRPGMVLGLGTGSTADEFVQLLGDKVADGLDIIGVPTSERTAELAERLSIPLTNLDDNPHLDLTVDGADEIDAELRLIKGGGGALLREKIVAAASGQLIVIADHTKLVDTLGAFALPIEVIPFGLGSTKLAIEKVASDLALKGNFNVRKRADGIPFVTDCGHLIIDASLSAILDVESLAQRLSVIPGVVEHGLFVNLATVAIVGTNSGIEVLERKNMRSLP